jgi:hypothetical protein
MPQASRDEARHRHRKCIHLEDMMSDDQEVKTSVLQETSNYVAWMSEEPDGETTYHLELGLVTLHFFQEEWDELLEMMRSLT